MTGDKDGRPVASDPDTRPAGLPPRSKQAVFLERQSYRRRRLGDVARLLPLFGALLLMVPLFWPGTDQIAGAPDPVPATAMSTAITYVFAVWALLILGAVMFGAGARRWGEDGQRSEQGHD